MTTEEEYMMLKVPPHSDDAEQALLGGLMINPKNIDEVFEIVESGDFYSPVNREIFKTLERMAANGRPIDVITVAEYCENVELVGGIGYLAEMAQSVPNTSNLSGYAKLIKTRSLERNLITVANEIADMGFDQSINIDEKLGAAQKSVMNIGESSDESDLIDSNKALNEWVHIIEARTEGKAPKGLMTGFKDIDARTNGFQDQDLVLIAARPSMGKTTFALNIAEHVAVDKRQPVLVFSMEMSSQQLWDKIGSSVTKIPLDRVRRGTLKDEDWPKLSAGVSKAKDAPIFIDERGGLNINQIKSTARRLHRKVGLKAVIIDYIQLARAKADNREREVSEISGGLKTLAKELNIPVIALSQLNRDLEKRSNKRPICADLRDSGSLEQDADIIIFLYRDEYYNESSPDKGVTEAIFGKFRNGEVGTDRLLSRLEISRFDDLGYTYVEVEGDRKSAAAGFDY